MSFNFNSSSFKLNSLSFNLCSLSLNRRSLSFNLNSSSFSSPIEFLLYNLFGEEVFRSSFAFNHPNLTITPVTVSNINIFNFKFFFGPSFFNSDYVLPGVYFYIVRSADMLIGKGKMGIIP